MKKTSNLHTEDTSDAYRKKRRDDFIAQYDAEHSWNRLQAQLSSRKKRRVWGYGISIAAFGILLWGIAAFLPYYSMHREEQFPVAQVQEFPETGRQRATLKLETGKQVDLSAEQGTIVESGSVVVDNQVSHRLTYQKVAQAQDKPTINTLSVPRGGEYQLVLSDGTRIWMNADSELRYPTCFVGATREVYLSGEAYFEVAKDVDHPFLVHTNRHTVNVLGTRFNVSAYPEHPIRTTLAEGKVQVKIADQVVELSPDQQAFIGLDSDQVTICPVSASLYTSWTQGIYEFRNTPLEEIVEQLERWYDVDICFKDEALKRKRFAGIVFRHEQLSMAIEIIEKVSQVRFLRHDHRIYLEQSLN